MRLELKFCTKILSRNLWAAAQIFKFVCVKILDIWACEFHCKLVTLDRISAYVVLETLRNLRKRRAENFIFKCN
jgi:hypothetical protein